MFQVDVATAVSSLPTPAAASTPGFFTNGNPVAGIPATVLEADFTNMLMMELVNVVLAGGLTPSKTTYNQVLSALRVMFAGINGNSADTFSVAPATQIGNAVNLGQFASSTTTNGYQKLPSGLIIEWGSLGGIPANGSLNVAYPLAFPNGVLAVSCITGASSVSANMVGGINANGTGNAKAGFTAWNTSTSAPTQIGYFIAIGL